MHSVIEQRMSQNKSFLPQGFDHGTLITAIETLTERANLRIFMSVGLYISFKIYSLFCYVSITKSWVLKQ